MTNVEAHEQTILWLGALLGFPVIKDRQGAARPALPYGMLDLANWGPIDDHATDLAYRDLDADDVEVTPEEEVEWTFLFFAYGPEGDAAVRKVQASRAVKAAVEPLERAGLVLHEVSRANSVPELVGEVWEARTQVNIVVRGMSSESFLTDVIEAHDFNFTGERA